MNKKVSSLTSVVLGVVLFTVGAIGIGLAQEHAHGEKRTFVGHVVGMACYFGHSSIGESHRECATTCAKNGIPLAILDQETQTLYVPLSKDHHAAANKELMALIEHDVRVTGTVVEKDGMKAITLESVSRAD